MLKLFKVVEKLQKTESPTDTLAVLRRIRVMLVCEKLSYEEMLGRCLHTEDITSLLDPVYPIFEKDMAELLKGKNVEEQIFYLTEMIMMF